ncbi:putative bifunctional diguanylate cyclase/phosphodiesterase [Sphingomonas sp.]|jgi:diguanylate cyclase (GGDEF)-like protein|uniref:putative bifunctional diguanylate cyclase/phosphodiesterase n=1 Tax=Sphingomonas sp. TaxID=28214 RepID=UPI002E34117F|nr:EAL domain-containing protein [Sphingomonas sp.]HEX4693475.1 EAL domain-containing protein [Sphingomonas sp.]
MSEPSGARRDLMSGAITVSAIVMFVGTGSAALSMIVSNYVTGKGNGANDQTLIIAMLLNVALILFGWRRHRDLAREVSERAAAEERANILASKDPLTGFLNRRSLAEEGAAMVVRADRRHKAMALMMLDLDHFKTVNDMHGHSVGDALLRAVAHEMAVVLPESALAARFGGDEFACAMLFDPGNPDSVERVAERLVSRMSQPFHVDGLHLNITASVGIARSDDDCATIDALLRAADIALYAAKNAGRNRHAWFDVSMEREMQARNELEGSLRVAVPRGEIVPYFDQQIDLTTGRLTGFEVLARWEHPQRGLIDAEHFVPIAEETGMIADLSMAVMRQAFVAARDWHPALTLAVNVSPCQFKDSWLAQKIIKLLTETGFPPNRLEVEITESALFDNMAMAQSVVGSLKNQGIKLVLDDFGTGYSSLAHLRALPFDRIKIDKSFVMSINQNPESAAIVNAIARLGESLNLSITAEGIEEKATEERLRALGCARGQGYCFGRPLSAANARRLLAERRLLATSPAETVEEPVTSRRRAG